jgi:hypothetical protein
VPAKRQKSAAVAYFAPFSAPKIFKPSIAYCLSLDTFAVQIFEKVKKGNINAYHSATCKKRTEEIDLQVEIACPGFLPPAQGRMYTGVHHYA